MYTAHRQENLKKIWQMQGGRHSHILQMMVYMKAVVTDLAER